MLCGERLARRCEDFVRIAVQFVGALQHQVRGAVQRRPRDQKGQSLKQVAEPFSVVECFVLRLDVVEIGKPLEICPKVA